jgi:hypothetical protein
MLRDGTARRSESSWSSHCTQGGQRVASLWRLQSPQLPYHSRPLHRPA